ncbi:hypothetical protein HK102_007975 [Quaeritorhiza haematococci]|nr:hypothetical protein HK102_007975 [Quaeritorhiza haematococci]
MSDQPHSKDAGLDRLLEAEYKRASHAEPHNVKKEKHPHMAAADFRREAAEKASDLHHGRFGHDLKYNSSEGITSDLRGHQAAHGRKETNKHEKEAEYKTEPIVKEHVVRKHAGHAEPE